MPSGMRFVINSKKCSTNLVNMTLFKMAIIA